MKPLCHAVLFCLVMLFGLKPNTFGQTSTFTYQGSLQDQGQPANGLYDMSLGLFTTETGGTAVTTVTLLEVQVADGLFTAALDYGDAVLDGADYWLEIGVKPFETDGPFTPLSPRQQITSAPYAITARHVSGPVPSEQLSGPLPPSIIGPNTITTAMLAPGSVTPSKLDPAIGIWSKNAAGIHSVGGKVGIGNTLPSVELDVSGTSRMRELDLTSAWGHLAINAWWDGSISNWRRIGEGYASLLQQSGSDGGLSIGVAGSDSAGELVDWRWPLALTRDGDVVIYAIGARESLSGGLRFGWSGSGEGIASKRGEGGNRYGLDFYTDNQPRLSIANGGKVGIGTSEPREKLEVEGGNIRIQGVDGYDEPGESAYLFLGGRPNYIKATRTFGMNLGVVGVPDAVTIRHQTGNVGIGTTDPATALDVVGVITADAFEGPIVASQLTGTIASDNIAPGTITSVMLADGAVTTTHIQNGTIKADDIANKTIGGDKIMSSSIISTHIQDNSVWSFDMVDEPGMKSSYRSSQVVGSTVTTLQSVTMTPPNSGFVVVLATARAHVVHNSGHSSYITYAISTTNTAIVKPWAEWLIAKNAAAGPYSNSLVAQRVYPVTMGLPVTFYFLAQKVGNGSSFDVSDIDITAMFFPTRY